MAAQDPMIGRSLGGYKILDLVGRGGMGTVYRAWDESRQQEIALKLLPLTNLQDLRDIERFEREARLAAQLDHPHIVSVFGSGRDAEHLYLAMELVRGQSLRQLLRQQLGLSVDQALGIASQVLMALQAAHERGIIHRDIKPENILVQEDGTAKILDFGVARLEGGTVLTRANEILGTVEYMAPEQLLGNGIGPAVDLYAAGVLLYEMLSRCLPFTGDSPATLVYRQLNQEPQSPSFLNPSVPRPLDRLVLRLLDKLPENRYGSAAAALTELEEIRQRHQMFDIPGLTPVRPEGVDEEEELRTRDFRPRFIGRQAELQGLASHFDALAEGGGRVVFLSGEAGIGKSRLVGELQHYTEGRGGLLIQGACFFEHSMGPYMPFLDALGDLFNKAAAGPGDEREELSRLLEHEAPELAGLVRDVSTTAKMRAGFTAAFSAEKDPEAARQRFSGTVFELLAAAARRRPLVIVLEDMHWADDGSIHLLQYLVRRAAEVPLLCVVTYRPEEVADGDPKARPWGELLSQLHAEGLAAEVRLGQLGRDEVAQLARSLFLEAAFAEDFADFLFAQSQGNPFIALEVLKLLRDQDILYCKSGVWAARADFAEVGIPDRVNALVMRRVDQLDTGDRELLQIAAVIGSRFSSAVLEKAAGLSRIDLLKALFRLEKRHRLIASVPTGHTFSHGKIQEVLYAEIPWELRREYHRIVAAILEGRQAEGQAVEETELGRHLYEAEEFARAIPHLARAGDEAYRLFGWRQAAALFDQVIVACRQSGGAVELLLHALRLSGCSYAYLTVPVKALGRFEEMAELALAAGRQADEAEAWLQLGRAHKTSQRFGDAVLAYEKALACLEQENAASFRGRVLLNWGQVDFECGRYPEAETRWQEALALLEEVPGEAGNALNNLAVLATVRGNLEQAWELYERVLTLDAQGPPSPQTVLTLYNMGMVRADQQRWDAALELYDRSLAVCRQTRFLLHEPAIDLNRAEALIGKGEPGAAREACSHALRGFRHLDDALGLADALRLYGRLCRHEHSWEDGQTYLEKSISLNRQFGESVSLGEALYELGLLHLESGQPALALEPLREAEGIFARAEATLDLNQVRTALEDLEAA